MDPKLMMVTRKINLFFIDQNQPVPALTNSRDVSHDSDFGKLSKTCLSWACL